MRGFGSVGGSGFGFGFGLGGRRRGAVSMERSRACRGETRHEVSLQGHSPRRPLVELKEQVVVLPGRGYRSGWRVCEGVGFWADGVYGELQVGFEFEDDLGGQLPLLGDGLELCRDSLPIQVRVRVRAGAVPRQPPAGSPPRLIPPSERPARSSGSGGPRRWRHGARVATGSPCDPA